MLVDTDNNVALIGQTPASSLGISASIDYRGHGVHSGDTDPWSFSNLRPLLPQQPLNGVETEWKNLAQRRGHTGHASTCSTSVPPIKSTKAHLWRQRSHHPSTAAPVPRGTESIKSTSPLVPTNYVHPRTAMDNASCRGPRNPDRGKQSNAG